MALHVHAAWLPQVAYTAGAILPYPVTVGPTNVAQAALRSYKRLLMPDPNPVVRQEEQPETIARWATRLANGMAQGLRPPSYTDQRLLKAARLINQGRNFTIKSAGRTIEVRVAPTAVAVEPGRTLSRAR